MSYYGVGKYVAKACAVSREIQKKSTETYSSGLMIIYVLKRIDDYLQQLDEDIEREKLREERDRF